MACTDAVCGTGGWAGPLPGDPDNNSVLNATAAFGGIDVSWTYPELNPQAVAYVMLYRGTSPVFELAMLRSLQGGNYFFDRIAKADIQPYFYWIRFNSVNGTLGDPIGPVSATPKSAIEEILLDLTGLIDAGQLSEELRTEIERVEILNQRIYQEELDRKSQNNILTTALAAVQADGDALTALLQQEVNLRISNNTALAAALTTTQAELEDNLATVQTTMQSSINTVDGKVTEIGALYTAKVGVNGLIGGFGIYNDGTEVEAGFDVDRFWVGRTEQAIKPFVIEGDVIYMNNVLIQDGTINSAKLAGTIQSDNFQEGSTGWAISRAGTAEFNAATFRGTLAVKSATSGSRMEIANNVIKVYGASGNLMIQMGDLEA